MAYVDKSTAWVLDQFFTYLDANQLGSNDQHLYDSLAVEHNINTSTVDGTHKTNSINGSAINTTPASTGNQHFSGYANTYWYPSVGVYQMFISFNGFANGLVFEMFISGVWYSGDSGSIVFCDGSNMRLFYSSGNVLGSGDVHYQKF